MVKLKDSIGGERYSHLASMGVVSKDIINKLFNPIDAMNRFLNLALQNTGEDSQSRQFILESKTGLREMQVLLKRLDNCARKIEKEFYDVLEEHK